MELIALAAFTLALNMESFAVGLAYGVRNIKLPLTALAVISLMFMAAITASMMLVSATTHYFSAAFAHKLGGAILLLLGIWYLVQAWQENRNQAKTSYTRGTDHVIPVHIRTLGLVLQISRRFYREHPDKYDVISKYEVVMLGLALSLDSFAAGFAASLLGFNIIYTALMAGFLHMLLNHLGQLVGKNFGTRISTKLTTLSGPILIALGLFKIH